MTFTFFLKIQDSYRDYLGILNVVLSQRMTNGANITIVNTGSRLLILEWCIYIWPWPILKFKLKVIQILTVIISVTVKVMTNIAIVNT